jgi:hypothetical protein
VPAGRNELLGLGAGEPLGVIRGLLFVISEHDPPPTGSTMPAQTVVTPLPAPATLCPVALPTDGKSTGTGGIGGKQALRRDR